MGEREDGARRRFVRSAALAAAGLALGVRRPAEAESSDPVAALARALCELYQAPGREGERWGGGPRRVRLPDGRELPREQAYRDHPLFVSAARRLLEGPDPGEAALGAWLMAGAPAAARPAAAAALLAALERQPEAAAFEAAQALAAVGERATAVALESRLASLPPGPVRSAAALTLERLVDRRPPQGPAGPLPPGFGRGVSWWFEGQDQDGGAASFAELRALGIDWLSIHTWDPLQRAMDDPRLIEPRRLFAPRDLPRVVTQAHAAGLKVLFKPHLEMGHAELSADERALLRSADGPQRRALVARLVAEREARGWHGAIEMKTERDWALWFAGYGDYVLEHARRAQAASCDAFCVGRELDRTVVARERDWRALVARVRTVFPRALTYSAQHESFASLGLWDALDAAGVAAYFPLAQEQPPSDAQLLAGAQAALARVAAFARRAGRPVWLTEAGYPALPTAAARPWDESRAAAEPWLQARCWQALLQALSRQPEIGGVFAWLWEGVSQPPFRDASFTLKDKPAAFVLARWFRGLGA